jgi:thiamine biosynthesis lipoprotein
MNTLVTAREVTRAMSCSASIVVLAPTDDVAAELARTGTRRVHELEQRWTRFSASSELSRLNAATGGVVRVSRDTVRLLEAMVRAWHATDGAFDPTLLCPLVGLGYAASRDDETRRTSLASHWERRGRVAEILVDPESCDVCLPSGTVIDAGGIGKGLAADLVVRELIDAGASGALVEIGGDLAVGGDAPGASGWRIAVTDPHGGAPAVDVELARGAVATSSTRLRTWSAAGEPRHHLLDARTLRPTDTDVVACTVLAGSATWAEAFTKVAFVDGVAPALERYDRLGLAARVSTADGHHHCSRTWGTFCR